MANVGRFEEYTNEQLEQVLRARAYEPNSNEYKMAERELINRRESKAFDQQERKIRLLTMQVSELQIAAKDRKDLLDITKTSANSIIGLLNKPWWVGFLIAVIGGIVINIATAFLCGSQQISPILCPRYGQTTSTS